MLNKCPVCAKKIEGADLVERTRNFILHMVAEPPNGHRNDPPVNWYYCPIEGWPLPGATQQERLAALAIHMVSVHTQESDDPDPTGLRGQEVVVTTG